MEPIILVVNPGSSSRKYALFEGERKKASLHFEYASGEIIGTLEFAGTKHLIDNKGSDFGSAARLVMPLLVEHKVLGEDDKLSAIGIRLVAPSSKFIKDCLITSEVESELEVLCRQAPLHIATVLGEIKKIRQYFRGIPIIAISDSAFHSTKPEWASYYGIDTRLADSHDIKRFGYHGISIESAVKTLRGGDMLLPKTIICHLGSGSSITALQDGKSIETSMGYSPLEGLMMATRSGSIDLSAALALERSLDLNDDQLEEYLNKNSGLIGVSGSSNDIRELLEKEKTGDKKAELALKMFVYRIQQTIGQMAASLGGVNSLVFTGTVGERSFIIRERVLNNLDYLDLSYDKELNDQTDGSSKPINIAANESKPIIVLPTDEAQEIARRAIKYMSNN